ncbi:MAG: ABC-type zinc uptake system zinc chaperone [Parashewanella sp.]
MRVSSNSQKWWAIWLSAVLLILSVAASAHSVEHVDHGINEHCTLCFHQHQLNHFLGQNHIDLPIIPQQYSRVTIDPLGYRLLARYDYRSRAPPNFIFS